MDNIISPWSSPLPSTIKGFFTFLPFLGIKMELKYREKWFSWKAMQGFFGWKLKVTELTDWAIEQETVQLDKIIGIASDCQCSQSENSTSCYQNKISQCPTSISFCPYLFFSSWHWLSVLAFYTVYLRPSPTCQGPSLSCCARFIQSAGGPGATPGTAVWAWSSDRAGARDRKREL